LQEEYIFERISAGRLKDIQYLYKACFNESVTIDFLRKKYQTQKFGANDTGYIAYDKAGSPAAYYGVFPCRVLAEGSSVLAAQSGDTMTHPGHRGKGLFIKLANKTYGLCRQEGIKFVFGFPNENSYHGFVKKLNWKHEENLNIFRIKVYTLPIAYISNKIGLFKGLYSWYSGLILKSRLSKRSSFANHFTEKGYYGLEHNTDFFEYKSGDSKHIIEINGKCVYIKISSALRIGDVESCSEEEFVLIIKQLKRLAWLLGNYAVIFYFSPGAMFEKYLQSHTETEKGIAAGWVDFDSGLDLSRLKFAQIDLDTF
jgi:GNAT superfamily N-acetyltransferase